jgi:hypothetical protein
MVHDRMPERKGLRKPGHARPYAGRILRSSARDGMG